MAVAFRAASGQGVGTTQVTIPAPAGIQADDLLLAFVVDHNTTSTPSTPPSGWNSLAAVGGASGRFQVFWTFFTSGASWIFTGLTTTALGEIVAYSGVNKTGPISGSAASVRQNASGTTGTLSMTPSATSSMMVLAFCSYANGTTYSTPKCATNPVTTTKRFDSNNGTSCSMMISDAIQNGNAGVASGDSSVTMTTAGTNAAILLSLNPSVPIQLVQSKAVLNNNSGASTTLAITVSPGNFVAVGVAWDSSVTLNSVLDNQSNSYFMIGGAPILSADGKMQTALCWLDPGLNTGGITSITASLSAPAHLVMAALEFSGIQANGTIDQSHQATATTANAQPGAITTTFASDLVISWIGITSLTVPTSPVPYSQAGITQPAQFANDLARFEYQVTNFTGTFGGAGTWSSTNVTNNSAIATFMAALPALFSLAVTGAGTAISGGTDAYKIGRKYTGAGSAISGGTDAYKIGFKYVGKVGAIASGADRYTFGEKYVGAGGAVATGTAAVVFTTRTTVTGAGGAISGGTDAYKVGRKYTGAGSAVAGGTAAVVFRTRTTATGAGNAILSGTASVVFKTRTTAIGVGGAVLAGTATEKLGVKFTGAGNAVLSGTASVNISAGNKFTGSGSAILSGTATEKLGVKFTGAGKATTSGTATNGLGVKFTGAGGAVAGGTDTYGIGRNYVGSGGATAGGTATRKLGVKISGAGGAIFAGTATQKVGAKFTGAGTAISGGTDTYTLGVKYTGLGGIVMGGGTGTAIIGSGAITMSGTASRTLGVIYTGSGTAIAGGSAVLRNSFTFFMSGSAFLLGTAKVSTVAEFLEDSGVTFTAWTGSVQVIPTLAALDVDVSGSLQ